MPYIIGAVVVIWFVLMPLRFNFKRQENLPLSLLFKAASTLVTVAFAGYACFLLPQPNAYALFIFLGLCLGVSADVWLEIRLPVGGVLFFLGHVVYIAGFLIQGIPPLSLAASGFILLALFAAWFLRRYRDKLPPSLYRSFQAYALALCALLSIGVALRYAAPSRRTTLAALGAALFVVSDMMLLDNFVKKSPAPARYVSLGIYYMAQFLLALSAFPIS